MVCIIVRVAHSSLTPKNDKCITYHATHNICRDLLKPADEVAEDVLEVFTDIEADELLDTPLSPDAGELIIVL